jgi:8-oxo-dGTP pyrophosphatase MutT (NUDIX family)
MVAGSILPIAIYKNQLYFLFGKENPLEDSAKGWSDFGGKMEQGETPYTAALREGSEELTGFLGDSSTLRKLINKNGGVYKYVHTEYDYHVHMFLIDYDENLPTYYNNNHHFLWKRMNQNTLNNTRLFEKIEIGWFSVADMKAKRNSFRPFYRNIVDKLLEDIKNIKSFISSR